MLVPWCKSGSIQSSSRPQPTPPAAAVILVAEAPASQVVPETARLTTEDVLVVEMEEEDTTDAGIYQDILDIRGQEKQPAKFMDESLFYNWKCMGCLTPLKRCQIVPKLDRMSIPTIILQKLKSTSLMKTCGWSAGCSTTVTSRYRTRTSLTMFLKGMRL